MKTGPQIQCRGCTMPILLAFVVADGPRRRLDCPACGHVHHWSVTDVTESLLGGDRSDRRSSVE